jgi:hypothetical protein
LALALPNASHASYIRALEEKDFKRLEWEVADMTASAHSRDLRYNNNKSVSFCAYSHSIKNTAKT